MKKINTANTAATNQNQSPEPNKPKKKGKKKWLLIIIAIIIVLSAFNGGNDSKDETKSVEKTNSAEETIAETTQETTQSQNIPAEIETICRMMTERFVENVAGEDYSMFAFNIQSFELHDNDCEIKVLYFPENAGAPGATKVNLTIVKTNDVYEIKEALLAGLYEVELSDLPASYVTYVTQD